MFRLINQKTFVHHGLIALMFCCTAGNLVNAQDPAAEAEQPKVSRELWQLLTDWSNASSKVQKLSGEHERHAYDKTFGIEKISKGKFWHEAPDKGRIDVFPIKITAEMIAAREEPGAQVEMKNGKPFQLQSDDAERWICDGTRVYDIDDEQKTARIVHLPPQVRGKNIMNSPLPFLFGMPPDKAVQRFNMKIVQDWRPKYNVVRLEALPRTREDAQNWSKSEILLDTSTFLPTAVKLVDPAGTKDTVYKFSAMEVNKNGIIEKILGKDPWDPKLGRDYDLHMIQPGQPQAEPPSPADSNLAPAGPVIPNVVGKNHVEATELLVQAGVPKENIKRQNAGPAPREDLTYIVSGQNPPPNTRIDKSLPFVMKIYDKARVAANAIQPTSARVPQSR
jgi:TIGR03009 family protein